MTGRRSLLVGAILALALGGLVLVACDSDSGGDGGDDTGGAPADTATASDTGGAPDAGGAEDTGGGSPDVPCVPNCEGRECGDDGCGGQCGTGCPAGSSCVAGGTCCAPSCEGRDCGSDGCGGNCGFCGLGKTCDADAGVCEVAGGLSCPAHFVCVDACEDGDDACATDCRTATTEEAGPLVDALAPCLEASCGDCGEFECLRSCGGENCGEDYEACFVGVASCGDIYTCVNACIQAEVYGTPAFAACRADCLSTGAAQAQQDYLDLEICIRQEGGCDPSNWTEYQTCENRALFTTCSAQDGDCPRG